MSILINMEEKTCPRCKITKPEYDYHRRSASADGLDTYCKSCRNGELRTPTTLESCQDEFVKVGAEKVLTNLGYEIYNPDNPVYRQFNERIRERYGITFNE